MGTYSRTIRIDIAIPDNLSLTDEARAIISFDDATGSLADTLRLDGLSVTMGDVVRARTRRGGAESVTQAADDDDARDAEPAGDGAALEMEVAHG